MKPLLSALLIVAFAALIPSLASAQNLGDVDALRDRALDAVNSDRADNGLPPLELDPQLNAAAIEHAKDMQQRRYYSHTSPEGNDVRDRYLFQGGSEWVLVAENIARCTNCETVPDSDTVDRLETGWMNSPEHRENILHEGLTGFGYGIASGEDGRLYAVQTFAGPGAPRGVTSDAETKSVAEADQVGVALRTINAARSEAGVAAIEESSALAKTARAILPESTASTFSMDQLGSLTSALPESERGNWSQLAQIAAACGGCGAEPTVADIESFVTDWLDDPAQKARLVSAEFSHIGFALQANGQGRKVAILVLGAHR